jgi:hypothetical protein
MVPLAVFRNYDMSIVPNDELTQEPPRRRRIALPPIHSRPRLPVLAHPSIGPRYPASTAIGTHRTTRVCFPCSC